MHKASGSLRWMCICLTLATASVSLAPAAKARSEAAAAAAGTAGATLKDHEKDGPTMTVTPDSDSWY